MLFCRLTSNAYCNGRGGGMGVKQAQEGLTVAHSKYCDPLPWPDLSSLIKLDFPQPSSLHRSELTHGRCGALSWGRGIYIPYSNEACSDQNFPAGYNGNHIGTAVSPYKDLVWIGLRERTSRITVSL